MIADNEYPERCPFFANKVIRLLQKTCAANLIGIEACWLITCIAMVEDSKHYSGGVAFWTAQLLPITGFNSWGRLDRARHQAVDAGWLYYRPGTNRQCGVYWTLIPPEVLNAFNDFPIDEVNHQDRAPNGDRKKIKTALRRSAHSEPSIPVPKTQGASASDTPSKSSPEDNETAHWMFEVVKKLQPNHRPVDLKKWANEIRKIREIDGRTDADIRSLFLLADQHTFWRKNIRSPEKLRKQWERLELDLKTFGVNGHQSPAANHAADQAWQKIQSAAYSFRYDAEKFAAGVGAASVAAMKAARITAKAIDEANEFDRREMRKRFIQEFNRKVGST